MSAGSGDRHLPSTAVAYERGAEQLLGAIGAACEREANFPARVEAALGATLALFAADRELASLLAVRPHGAGEEALRCYGQGLRRFAALLRRAAASEPEVFVQPDFFEPAMMGGIAWQIARHLDDEAAPLEDLLPGLLEFVLVCYFGPKEGVGLARASRIAVQRTS